MTDPIADMLTRIRNALIAKHESVEVPASNMKKEIARLLLQEGYITSYELVEEEVQSKLVITLKYGPNGEKVINGLKRVSKPGLRKYTDVENMPRVLNGLGIAILSTSKGIITDKEAKDLNVGGEVICYVY